MTTRSGLKKLHATFPAAYHLFASTALHASSALHEFPLAIDFLIAGIRSPYWALRTVCVGGLLGLYFVEGEDDKRSMPFDDLVAVYQRPMPKRLKDALKNENNKRPMTSDLARFIKIYSDHQDAMHAVAEDGLLLSWTQTRVAGDGSRFYA